MSATIPRRSIGDHVRVMQTKTAEAQGVSGKVGKVDWISENEIRPGAGRRCRIIPDDNPEMTFLADECLLAGL